MSQSFSIQYFHTAYPLDILCIILVHQAHVPEGGAGALDLLEDAVAHEAGDGVDALAGAALHFSSVRDAAKKT